MMGKRLDARVTQGGDTLAVLPVPAGPWSMLESGSRKRSWIEPKGKGGRRLRIGNDVRIRVVHGPIRGKRTWTNVQDEMTQQFFKVARTEAANLWRSVSG